MFSSRSVCLSVRRITEKVVNGFWQISWSGRAWPRDQWVQFWWRSGSASGSRSPKSAFNGLSKKLPTDFNGELGDHYILVSIRKFITCKFHHVPFTANFHYLQIQPPLLSKSITCNFSAPNEMETAREEKVWRLCGLELFYAMEYTAHSETLTIMST